MTTGVISPSGHTSYLVGLGILVHVGGRGYQSFCHLGHDKSPCQGKGKQQVTLWLLQTSAWTQHTYILLAKAGPLAHLTSKKKFSFAIHPERGESEYQ